MMENPFWVPHDIDTSAPNAARVYDYFLGGSHNFAADREMGDKLEQAVPAGRDAARVNRAFLRRIVRFMVGSGIRQFLDIGSGIPTVGNVHEIAQKDYPECRIVYVDKEPIAVAHSNRCTSAATRRCCAFPPGSSWSSRDWLAALSGDPRDQAIPQTTPK